MIFLLFGIPALTFFTDDCYNEDDCRHVRFSFSFFFFWCSVAFAQFLPIPPFFPFSLFFFFGFFWDGCVLSDV